MLSKFIIQWLTFLLIVLISFSSVQHPVTSGYINELRERADTVMKQEDPLYMEILKRQKDYEIAPVDAVIDKVWKAIPGYNGLKLDVQASFERLKEEKEFQEEKLVFTQIPPETVLADLPPSPVYRGNPEKPMAALMVNVAWGNEYLPGMLKTMKKHGIQSTFFLDGSWVKNNPNLAKMIVEEGHEIGNHAYSHPDMKNLSRAAISEEIRKTNEVIEAVLDLKPELFAPPSGSYRQDVVEVAREHGMYTILWTADTVDWKKPEPFAMAERTVSKTEPGALILMHPTSSAEDGLEAIITGIREKGLVIGTVSDVLSENRIARPKQ
jgi:probable sporulation protein (polysaccharide deacetylase family)